jgi:TonB family protein
MSNPTIFNPKIFDELDMAIDRLLAGDACPDVRTGIAELLEVVPELRYLPRADFKARLKLQLEWQASGRAMSAPPAPAVARVAEPRADRDLVEALSGRVGGLYPVRGSNFAASIVLHAAMLLFAGLGLVMVRSTARMVDPEVASAVRIGPYIPPAGHSPNDGGGGGGSKDKIGASKGQAPRFAPQPLAPPTVLQDHDPKLPVEARLFGPPQLNLPQTQTGDPLSNLLAPSNGVGISGIGSGRGDGVGPGDGPGNGPGSGGGFGGNVYRPGDGVTAPRAIYTPDPEFSDEARRVKFQGVVTLLAVIGPDGRPRRVSVTRALGMGLDEKAIEALRTWRFEPGRKDGRPVAVEIEVEVDFRLY